MVELDVIQCNPLQVMKSQSTCKLLKGKIQNMLCNAQIVTEPNCRLVGRPPRPAFDDGQGGGQEEEEGRWQDCLVCLSRLSGRIDDVSPDTFPV